MVTFRLKFVISDCDRHGNVRHYFRRRRDEPKVRLRGAPGSKEFTRAYEDALAETQTRPRQAGRASSGSFAYVCQKYFASAEFAALNASTRGNRRRILEKVCEAHGEKPVALMQGKHARKLRDEIASTPAASTARLKALRALFGWAVEHDEAPHDPTIGVKKIHHRTDGHHTWTLAEIAAYEKRHPIGSQARLAMSLMLYTACRREDAVRLGPQHIQEGRFQFRQAKNEHRSAVDVDMPVFGELATIIDRTKSGHLTFLVTEYGRPFGVAGFGNKFKDWCRQADLPHCSAHGLRKATAARLAEKGASTQEIMAITGHRSISEVERYTRDARRALMADSAMAKLKS